MASDKRKTEKIICHFGEEFGDIPLDAKNIFFERHFKTPVGPYSVFGFKQDVGEAYFASDPKSGSGFRYLGEQEGPSLNRFYSRIADDARAQEEEHRIQARRMQELGAVARHWRNLGEVSDLTKYVDEKLGLRMDGESDAEVERLVAAEAHCWSIS